MRYKHFKSDDTVVEHVLRSGHPSTVNTEQNVKKMKKIGLENLYNNLRKLANGLSIEYGTIQHTVEVSCSLQ